MNLNESMGFWVHITQPEDTLFVFNGTQPTENQMIQLYEGWNLVGYPSKTDRSRSDALNNLDFPTHVNSIWTYNASAQLWEEMGPSDNFERGRGYWIHATGNYVWEVPFN